MAAKGSVGHGKDFSIIIDDSGGNARDVSGDCRDFSWPAACAVAEAMGAGDASEEYVAGLKGSKISGTFMLNDAATTGSWTVMGDSQGGTRTVTFAPIGATAGYPEIEAEVMITEVNVTAGLTDTVTFTIAGVSTGDVTVTTVGA